MTEVQSIPIAYRITDALASGFPIDGIPTLQIMVRERERTDFGQRLFEARTGAKLSQPALAAKVGMAQSTLAEAESARHGSSFTAQLAAATGVRAEWLASGVGPKFPTAAPAQEPQSDWPFPKVALARVLALEPDDLGYVQRRLLQAVEECEGSAEPQVEPVSLKQITMSRAKNKSRKRIA